MLSCCSGVLLDATRDDLVRVARRLFADNVWRASARSVILGSPGGAAAFAGDAAWRISVPKA